MPLKTCGEGGVWRMGFWEVVCVFYWGDDWGEVKVDEEGRVFECVEKGRRRIKV
jgi:hypothetical protein